MIGAVIAMQIEADVLLSQMEAVKTQTVFGKPCHFGKAFGRDFLVCVCGVGKVNSAVGACIALSLGATALFNLGVAGGLHGKTEVGSVYLIDRAVQYDFDLTQLNGTKMGTLDEYDENYLPVALPSCNKPFEVRALGSGDRFNDSPVDHALLTDELGADIRDMEGAAIAQVCKAAGVPFYSVKAISDVYGGASTTDQYLKNRAFALENLKRELATIVEGIA